MHRSAFDSGKPFVVVISSAGVVRRRVHDVRNYNASLSVVVVL